MDARLKYFTTTDRVELYYEWWIPDNPKANIIFIHGLGDHMGRYGEFVRYFATRGIGVCLFDLRGHGRSFGRRMHCRFFNDFLRDISQFVDMVHDAYPNTPRFLVGHSFGGQLAINFAVRYSKGLRGIVVLSPNIEPLVKISPLKRWIARYASTFFPILKIKVGSDPCYFSHDEKVVEMAKTDPLMNWHVTARLGMEVLGNLGGFQLLAFRIRTPLLLMHGGDDKICSVDAARKFYHHLLVRNKEIKVYPGLYHELLNENIRNKVYADIETWINGQVMTTTRLAVGGNYEKNFDLWDVSGDHIRGQ